MSVFISHATADRAIAERACGALEAAGVRCWVAWRDIVPGASYAESIVEAIDRASALVLVMSAAANQSPHVLRELEHATNRALRIVPFRIDAVEPTKAVRYFIGTSHWLQAGAGLLDSSLAALVQALAGKAGSVTAASVSPSSAAANLNPVLVSALVLRVESGPDAGLVVPLGHTRVIAGRGMDVDVHLTDAAISRAHFALTWNAASGQFTLQGFQALNPILVNGEKLAGSKPIAAGDRIAVGNTVMVIEAAG